MEEFLQKVFWNKIGHKKIRYFELLSGEVGQLTWQFVDHMCYFFQGYYEGHTVCPTKNGPRKNTDKFGAM